MKSCVRLDETHAALPVVRAAGDAGEFSELSKNFRVSPFERGELSGLAFYGATEFVDLVQDLKGDLRHEVAAVWDDAKESFVLQSDGCLAYRGTAAFVAAGEVLLVQRFTGLVDAMNDVPFERSVYFFAERGGRTGGGRVRRRQWSGRGKRKPSSFTAKSYLRQGASG